MKLTESILYNNPCYKAGRKLRPVKGLMLHSVGVAQPNASVFINMWNKSSYSRACVHGFIDANTGEVFQTLPWDHRGWHCASGSKGSANNTHIGVEMCEPSSIKYVGGATVKVTDMAHAKACVARTYKSAVELFAYLCKKFNLNPLGDGVILSHKEGHARGVASNHGDPEHLWTQLGTGYTMNGFRKDVAAAMNGVIPADPKPVTVSALNGTAIITYDGNVNVRNTPDYNAPAVTTYGKGTKSTVVGITSDKEFYKLSNGMFLTTNKKYVAFSEVTKPEEKEEVEVRYNKIAELPDYAKATITKLVDRKVVNGTGTGKVDESGRPADLDLSLDMVRTFVVLDKAGLFDK